MTESLCSSFNNNLNLIDWENLNIQDYDSLVENVIETCLDPTNRKEIIDFKLNETYILPIPLSLLCLNLVLLKPLKVINLKPKEEFLFDKQVVGNLANKHIDMITKYMTDNHDDIEQISTLIADVVHDLSKIAIKFVSKIGVSISVRDFKLLERENPKITNYINYVMTNDTIAKMEEDADLNNKEFIAEIKKCKKNNISRLLTCGAAVNENQFRQAAISIGFKPGVEDGSLVEEPVNTSFLQGLKTPQDYYTCAGGARKALITNLTQVKNSGYLSRKFVLLTVGQKLGPVQDCGTLGYIQTKIQSETHLKCLEGRYIRSSKDEEWRVVDLDNDRELIGSIIHLRSPAKCASEDICAKCYGKFYKINKDIHAGIFAVLIICEQFTQRLLSSKHLLKAKPIDLEWTSEFLASFVIEKSSIFPEKKLKSVSVTVEQNDDLFSDTETDLVTRLIQFTDEEGEEHVYEADFPLILSSVWDEADQEESVLTLSSFDLNEPIFKIPLVNSDASSDLKKIFTLVQNHNMTNFDEMYDEFFRLIEASKIKTPSVHIEMILRGLLKAPDLLNRPDFGSDENPEYKILTLPKAILNSSSLTNTLAFEEVKDQLTSYQIFRKTQKSDFDFMFKL